MLDKEIMDVELEELELQQRQLDLDRKKLQLRLRRAMLDRLAEAAPDRGQDQVKAESTVKDTTEIELGAASNEHSAGPGRDEAASISTAGDRRITQEISLPQHLVLEAAGCSPREHHGGTTASNDPVTTSSSPSSMPHPKMPSTEPSRQCAGSESVAQSCVASPLSRSNSQTTSSTPTLNYWQQDGFGHLPTSSPHKRERSPGRDSVLGKSSTPRVKCVKKSTSNTQAQSKTNTQSPKVQRLPAHHISAIIRRYGERLVQRHMHTFRKHERWEADEIIKAGSKIIDGLLEKKFKSLEELHDEYDRQIRLCCTGRLQGHLTFELQKFRRAGPVWWRKCMRKRTQEERFADVAAVFQDVVEGIFD